MFRLVSYLYILRFSITLNISLVYDQILQKAGMYINLLAKKLGQPFSEIHAYSISGKKQKTAMMAWWVFVWLVLILQPLLEQGCSSEASWFFFNSLLKFSAPDDCTAWEWHLNRSLIRYQANKVAPLTKSIFCHLFSSHLYFPQGLPFFIYPMTQIVDLSSSTTKSWISSQSHVSITSQSFVPTPKVLGISRLLSCSECQENCLYGCASLAPDSEGPPVLLCGVGTGFWGLLLLVFYLL